MGKLYLYFLPCGYVIKNLLNHSRLNTVTFRACLAEIGFKLQNMASHPTDISFSKIQVSFTFLVPANPGSPGQRAVKRVCVCVIPEQFLLEL